MEVRFSDGSTTYNLYTGSVSVLEYTPKVEDRNKDQVTDSLIIFIAAGSLTAQQTTKDTINGWLALAREQWETVNETRIYIEIKQASETDWRRSELLGGKLQPMAGTLDSHSQIKQEYQLVIERRNWWEWDEVELPLSLDNASFATGGVAITNAAEAIFLQGADVEGDPYMALPARVELSQSGSYADLLPTFIAHNVFGSLDPLLDEHILLGEDGAPHGTSTATSTVAADALCRSGNRNRIAWTSPADNEWVIDWTLSGAQLAGAAGKWYRILLRAKGSYTDPVFGHFALYSSLYSAGHQPIQKTEPTKLTYTNFQYDIADFGAIQIPSFVSSVAASESLKLTFVLRSAATSGQIDFDFIQLSPTDSFHYFQPAGTATTYPAKLILDGRIDKSYMVAVAGGVADTISDVSKHIRLWPSRDQWITVLRNGEAIDHEWTAKIYYRPRRVTV